MKRPLKAVPKTQPRLAAVRKRPLAKSGASAEDLALLDAALSKAVAYKDHTPSFLGISISDQTYSGLSMYLPKMGSSILNSFYRDNVSWNDATELVK